MDQIWNNFSLENLTIEYEGKTYIEEWRSVIGLKGFYEISSFGRVKSLERINRSGCLRTGRFMKQNISRKGYLRICLTRKDGKQLKYHVHQLVARAFLLNPKRKRTVNHKKGRKLFNFYKELEWATCGENIQHAFDVLGRRSSKPWLGKKTHNSKIVLQVSSDGFWIGTYESFRDAGNAVNRAPACIGVAVRRKNKSAGYYWL